MPDPEVPRQALVRGGLGPDSTALLDAAGLESWREAARVCGPLGEVMSWPQAVAAIESTPEGAGGTVVEAVAQGDTDAVRDPAGRLLAAARGVC